MKAVVDIGSNTVKFSIAEPQAKPYSVLKSQSWVTRLGKGLRQNNGHLDPQSIQATQKALKEMNDIFSAYSLRECVVVGTSALRDCKDASSIQEAVKSIFKTKLQILSGQEEAQLSMQGAQIAAESCFPQQTSFAFIDIGGASTEVILKDRQKVWMHSFQAGAVRCHEDLQIPAPCPSPVWLLAQESLKPYFPSPHREEIKKRASSKRLCVGIGGSLVVAAKLAEKKNYGSYGSLCTREALTQLNERLRQLSIDERLQLKIPSGRADIICAGLLCLEEVLAFLNPDEILITEWGLRHGLLFGTLP